MKIPYRREPRTIEGWRAKMRRENLESVTLVCKGEYLDSPLVRIDPDAPNPRKFVLRQLRAAPGVPAGEDSPDDEGNGPEPGFSSLAAMLRQMANAGS